MNAAGPDHYRFAEFADAVGVHIGVQVFKVIKETPRGYWVLPTWEFDIITVCPEAVGRKRFVLKDSWRRYCYPSRAEALRSFRIRKSHHLQRLNYQLALAQVAHDRALTITDEELETGTSIYCGKPELLNSYLFDS